MFVIHVYFIALQSHEIGNSLLNPGNRTQPRTAESGNMERTLCLERELRDNNDLGGMLFNNLYWSQSANWFERRKSCRPPLIVFRGLRSIPPNVLARLFCRLHDLYVCLYISSFEKQVLYFWTGSGAVQRRSTRIHTSICMERWKNNGKIQQRCCTVMNVIVAILDWI